VSELKYHSEIVVHPVPLKQFNKEYVPKIEQFMKHTPLALYVPHRVP